MQRIDEAKLNEAGWHGGTLQYVKLISFPDAADLISLEPSTYCIQDLLSDSSGFEGPFKCPDLHTDSLDAGISLFFWYRIKVKGQEYVAVVAVRSGTPILESNILIFGASETHGGMIIEPGLEIFHKGKNGILLPVVSPDGAWIPAAMTRIKSETEFLS
mgnify:CR=1 FL=1|jgi:hypothetical protein